MELKLTAQQISQNWDILMSRIDAYIAEPRRTQLKDFYSKFQERIIMMPASYKKEYHNVLVKSCYCPLVRIVIRV